MEPTKRHQKNEKPREEGRPIATADLLDVNIEGETAADRLKSFLSQVDDPYCFRVGQTTVRVSFHNETDTLSDRLKSYFVSLKLSKTGCKKEQNMV